MLLRSRGDSCWRLPKSRQDSADRPESWKDCRHLRFSLVGIGRKTVGAGRVELFDEPSNVHVLSGNAVGTERRLVLDPSMGSAVHACYAIPGCARFTTTPDNVTRLLTSGKVDAHMVIRQPRAKGPGLFLRAEEPVIAFGRHWRRLGLDSAV